MRYLITGGSGYIGSRLTEILGQRDETEKIINVDVRPPEASLPKATFVSGDVRDSGAIRALLEREEIDGIVAPVDGRLHHGHQGSIRECRNVVEVDVAQTKASYQGAALAVEFEIDF